MGVVKVGGELGGGDMGGDEAGDSEVGGGEMGGGESVLWRGGIVDVVRLVAARQAAARWASGKQRSASLKGVPTKTPTL